MPRIRLYCPQHICTDAVINLTKEHNHYLYHVMRQKEGDNIELFNDIQGSWLSRIIHISKKHCQLLPQQFLSPARITPDIWLCFTPVKQAPMHFLIQKATELGIRKFIPVLTDRCIAKHMKCDKYQTHAIEAAQQCMRSDIPIITEPVKLTALLSHWDSKRTLLMCDETGKGPSLPDMLHSFKEPKPLAILIGPEGGFSPKEFELCNVYTYIKRITLGPRILRADTAALCSLSVCMSIYGDWDHKPSFA